MITILDCYTDEPAGLGVPPYLGTYPRYIAGHIIESLGKDPVYITIDDLRFFVRYSKVYDGKTKEAGITTKKSQKTDIYSYNITRNINALNDIFRKTSEMIIILGVHTPGKYLSAVPGTLNEVRKLLNLANIRSKLVLTGPAITGTQSHGGRKAENPDTSFFDIKNYDFSYEEISRLSVKGAAILKQVPNLRIIEIETGKGCQRFPGCSFCTEPLKNRLQFRDAKDILSEISALTSFGARDFRLGKQSCYYSHPKASELVKSIRQNINPRTLHIDNVNPVNVIKDSENNNKITKSIVEYCTPGNVAAFGAETFDPEVIKKNNLACSPEIVYKAAEIINKYGSCTGSNGMPVFLPGINLLLGLIGETKHTLEENYLWLKKMLDNNILLRRINIRQVVPYPGTMLDKEAGIKYIKKNKKHYFSFRKKIRESIDFEMLKKVIPEGTILRDVFTEIYDGNNTFGRQIGTYPIVVGIRQRLELKRFYDLKVKNHMLRSVTCEVI